MVRTSNSGSLDGPVQFPEGAHNSGRKKKQVLEAEKVNCQQKRSRDRSQIKV